MSMERSLTTSLMIMGARTKFQQENRDKRLQRLLFKEKELQKKMAKVTLQIANIDKKITRVKVSALQSV